MIYYDYDYKIDCEHKIPYNKLIKINEQRTDVYGNSEFAHMYSYTDEIAKKLWTIYIVKASDLSEFYVKNIELCTEIAPSLFKIVVQTDIAQAKTLKKTTKTSKK